jgi:beta-glucosidase
VYCAPPKSATSAKEVSSDWADIADRFQKLALESRLRIPIIYGTDAVHGNNNVYGTTIFPHNVSLGATRSVVYCFFSFYFTFLILLILP